MGCAAARRIPRRLTPSAAAPRPRRSRPDRPGWQAATPATACSPVALPCSEIRAAHLAETSAVTLEVDQIAGDLDHVLEAAADGRQCGFDVLKHLGGLSADAFGDLAVGVDASLTGEIDGASGTGDLDHVAVGRRFRHARRIGKAQVRGRLRLRLRATRGAGNGRRGNGGGDEITA